MAKREEPTGGIKSRYRSSGGQNGGGDVGGVGGSGNGVVAGAVTAGMVMAALTAGGVHRNESMMGWGTGVVKIIWQRVELVRW